MRPKAAFLFFFTLAAILCSGTGAFAALEGPGITPMPQDNPNADTDTSLSRSVDLSLPAAGVTDSQSPLNATLDGGQSSDSQNGTGTTAPPGKDDPCYNATISEASGSPENVYTLEPGDEGTSCEKNWKTSNDNIQTFCKTYDYAAADVTYVDSSGKNINLGDRCTQLEGSGSGAPGSSTDQTALQLAVADIDPTTATGSQQLSDILSGAGVSGITPQIVQSNPEAAQNLADYILQGDQTGAQSAAQELGLNSDMSNISQMQSSMSSAVTDALPSDQISQADQLAQQGQDSTFNQAGTNPTQNQTPLQDQGAYDQIRSLVNSACSGQSFDCTQFQNSMIAVCQQESGCTATADSGTGCTGAFQVCGSSQSYWIGQGDANFLSACSANGNDATCQAVQSQCSGGGDLRTNFVCNSAGAIGMQMQLEPQIQSVAPNDAASQAAIHEMYGLSPNQVVSALNSSDPLNASIGAGASNFSANGMSLPANPTLSDGINAIWNKGSGLQAGLAAATGGSTGPLVASAGVVVASGGSPFSSVTGDFVSTSGGGSPQGQPLASAGSPFAAVSYIPASVQSSASPLNSLLPLLLTQSLLNSVAPSTVAPPPPPAPVQSASTQTPTTATGQVSNVPPSVTITAQPPIVVPGNPISVSWSTAGVVTNPPCQISQNSTAFAQGANGSTTVPTTKSTPTGKTTFTIQCTSTAGQSLQQSASVVIN